MRTTDDTTPPHTSRTYPFYARLIIYVVFGTLFILGLGIRWEYVEIKGPDGRRQVLHNRPRGPWHGYLHADDVHRATGATEIWIYGWDLYGTGRSTGYSGYPSDDVTWTEKR